MSYKPLTEQEIIELNASLHYCKVGELQDICHQLHIPAKGKKPHLIASITEFVRFGTVPAEEKIPAASCKKAGMNYPLAPETRMVYGAFKNDLATRLFLKTLVGSHFYYTVFGLDWIKKQWRMGTPPTYAEFARFWQEEFVRRQGKQQELKPEWAYLNFARMFQEQYPTASKSSLLAAWEKVRLQHKENALLLLRRCGNVLVR
jgi:hypothetical protein